MLCRPKHCLCGERMVGSLRARDCFPACQDPALSWFACHLCADHLKSLWHLSVLSWWSFPSLASAWKSSFSWCGWLLVGSVFTSLSRAVYMDSHIHLPKWVSEADYSYFYISGKWASPRQPSLKTLGEGMRVCWTLTWSRASTTGGIGGCFLTLVHSLSTCQSPVTRVCCSGSASVTLSFNFLSGITASSTWSFHGVGPLLLFHVWGTFSYTSCFKVFRFLRF